MVLQLPPNIFCTQCWNLSMHCGDVHVGEEVLKSLSLLHEHTHTPICNHIRTHWYNKPVMMPTEDKPVMRFAGTILWVMDLYLQYQWHDVITARSSSDILTWRFCSSFSFCSKKWLASLVLLSKSFTMCWCYWAYSSCSRGVGEGRRGEERGKGEEW